MRIALVEPYLGGSHATWALGYEQHSAHDVFVVSHTDRFWKWRMHGAHVTLAAALQQEVARRGPVDVVVGSSMLNAAGFLGLTRGFLGSSRFALFMHENQLGYPLSPRDKVDLSYPMINWTSMVAADRVVFNSAFHRDEWFAALPGFLRQFPDYQQHQMIPQVRARSQVLPIGMDLQRLDALVRSEAAVPRILWNQRWEYDKGPEELAAAITELDDRGVEFEMVLAGEQFPTDPEVFVELRRRLGPRMVHYGFAALDEYSRLLADADIVLSTAHHEYFGISITEAIYAGAFPLLPNRLVYPERIPADTHQRCLYDDPADLVTKLEWAATNRKEAGAIGNALKPEMAVFDWSIVAPQYDAVLEALVRAPNP